MCQFSYFAHEPDPELRTGRHLPDFAPGRSNALALFKKHYPGYRDNDDELLKAIRNAVGGNTLVLELLAKNLAVINNEEVFIPWPIC